MLTVYAHLINTDGHTGNVAALGAPSAAAQKANCDNVTTLQR